MRKTAAALLTAALGTSVLAQTPPSVMTQAKQIAEVAAQKTEADVRAALNTAGRLAAADKAQAVAVLRGAVAQLETDQTLSEGRRAQLLRVVKDRLRVAESGPAQTPTPATDSETKSKENDQQTRASDEKVKSGLAAIAKLRKEGKTVEAEKLAADLASKHPESIALQLLNDKAAMAKGISEYEKTRKVGQANTASVMLEVDKAGSPLVSDMTFPDDWKERTKDRTNLTAPSAEERALLKTLETPVDANFKNSRFQDVMDYFSTAGNRTIIVDPLAASEVSLTYESPINMSIRGQVSMKTALRQVLAPYNLTFVVRDGVIHVTTPLKARDLMTTKVYYLGDLIFGGLYGGAPSIGVAADQVQVVQNISALVEMITSSIDPMSWEKRGGNGHLGVNMPTLSLTVRQSQEVHVLLRSSLYGKK